jgi:hypothetical protein
LKASVISSGSTSIAIPSSGYDFEAGPEKKTPQKTFLGGFVQVVGEHGFDGRYLDEGVRKTDGRETQVEKTRDHIFGEQEGDDLGQGFGRDRALC